MAKELIYYPNPEIIKEPLFELNSLDEMPVLPKYSLSCNGVSRVVYCTDYFHYAPVVVDEAGGVDVEITVAEGFKEVKVRPSSYGIEPAVEGNKIFFHLDSIQKVSVEVDGDLKSALFVLCSKRIPKPENATVCFEKGNIYNVGTLELKAGDTVYIEEGAVVLGRVYPAPVEERRGYAAAIAHREHKSYPYTDGDFPVYGTMPKLQKLQDGQEFGLGGRTVTAWHCPGHTPGEMVFIDSQARILFCGDACNNNLILLAPAGSPAFVSVETAARALHRIYDMRGSYDKAYNGHHDYRGFGALLADDVLPDALQCYDDILEGRPNLAEVPDMFDPSGGKTRTVAVRGKTMVSYHPDGVWDKG